MGPPPGALPPMRMTASWSGSKRTYRIQVCGAKMRPNGKLPSDHYPDRRRQTPQLQREAHLAVHRPSACSGNLIAGDGTKNGPPAPNKELSANQKHYLTGKAPYKFESRFLRQGVGLSGEF